MDYGVGLDASLRLTWDQEAHVSPRGRPPRLHQPLDPRVRRLRRLPRLRPPMARHQRGATPAASPPASPSPPSRCAAPWASPWARAPSAPSPAAGSSSASARAGCTSERAGRPTAPGPSPRWPSCATTSPSSAASSTASGSPTTAQPSTVRGLRLDVDPPPRTPVYLGALGPQMLRLAGERADGVALNWCTAEQVAWSRERIAEGAARAGRSPADVKVVQYIRVCVDEDEDRARRAFVPAMLGYALGRRGATPAEQRQGYRGHFERMGFGDALARLEDMRDRGASPRRPRRRLPARARPARRLLRPRRRRRRRLPLPRRRPRRRHRPRRPRPPRPRPRHRHHGCLPTPLRPRLSWGRGRRVAAGEGDLRRRSGVGRNPGAGWGKCSITLSPSKGRRPCAGRACIRLSWGRGRRDSGG